ncbi:MAG: DUF4124 domain-containing protein [Pseudomonadota bacterium]
MPKTATLSLPLLFAVQALLPAPVLAQTTTVEISPGNICFVQQTTAVTQTSAPRIYRWTDDKGQVHFSDRAPSTANAAVVEPQMRAQDDYFDLTIENRGNVQAPFFQTQLTGLTNGIYRILSNMLGKERLRQVDLHVLLFPDANSYYRYGQEAVGMDLRNTEGFYTPHNNQAVTYVLADRGQTLEAAKHESTHVIAAGILGSVPFWLNEGLAEYFAELEVQAQFTQVRVNEDWLWLARTSIEEGYPANLKDFLALDASGWRTDRQAHHYALGWALVYFMMGTEQGRSSLGQLLQIMADNYCEPLDANAKLDLVWPGGVNVLQQDFYAWLRDPAQKRLHVY